MPKTEARILGFGDVRVRNTELVTEFTSDQLEMINKTVVEAITGAIMAMIAELIGDWIGDRIRDQSEMINETAMEMTSELILEMILELTGDPVEIGDPDGCPLTVGK